MYRLFTLQALSGRTKLEGVIEIDEVFVGGKITGKRGRGAEGKSLVVVAVEVKGRKTTGSDWERYLMLPLIV